MPNFRKKPVRARRGDPVSTRLFRSAFPLDGGPTTPEQILAFHRATFGAAQMNDEPSTTAPAAPAGAAGGTAPEVGAAVTTPSAQTPATPAESGKVEDLPEWAQKIIRDSRDEAGKARTTAKATAAAEARTALAQEIGKALGLVKDDETPDPARLTEQLTAERADRRTTAAELVIWRHAADLKVDPTALTDSVAFRDAIKNLDPGSETFAEDVKKAATAAAESNPRLKAAAQAAAASTVQHAGGSGEGSITKAQFDAMTVSQKTALYESDRATYNRLLGLT